MSAFVRLLFASSLSFATVSAAEVSVPDYAWIEGESPTVRPLLPNDLPETTVRYGDAWGLSRIMSGEKVLHLNVSDNEVEKYLPEGLTFSFDLTLATGGKKEIWARVGYEWTRSPIRWRIAGGAWHEYGSNEVTRNVMQLQAWNELGWAHLGDSDTSAGVVRLDIHWPRTEIREGTTKKTARILGILDAICVAAPGIFHPQGALKPGEKANDTVSIKATNQVFSLTPSTIPGERSSVSLTGAWQIADWEELLATGPGMNPHDRLSGITSLPALDQLAWSGYLVPGDRNTQYPERVLQHRMLARCRVDIPQQFSDHAFHLNIERFNTIASVFVNGKACGWSKNHSTAWQVDLTAEIKPGQINEVVIAFKDRYYSLDAARDPTNPLGWLRYRNLPSGFLSDNQGVCSLHDLPVAADPTCGLTEPVTLVATGPTYVSNVFVKTSVKNHRLAVEATLTNPGPARTVNVNLTAHVWSPKNVTSSPALSLKPLTVTFSAGETKTVELAESWFDAQLWWPDDVHLYELRTTVTESDRCIDQERTRFGFREWSWDSHVFKLNGIKWQLYGDIDTNSEPQALTAQAKVSGQNVMRLWANGGFHGMTRDATLSYFDETGMVVRSSGTFDGQMANYGGGLVEEIELNGKKIRRVKQTLMDNWKAQLAAWVRAERNHPSIAIWSVENEITYINSCNLGMADEFEPAVSDAIRNVVMKVDPTRPAMVDGGNALKDESLPVNGAHYTEMYNCSWRDLPDASYTREHWYTPESKNRGMWRFVPERPIFMGEVFFASGYGTEQFATIGGERCFIGVGEVGDGMRRLGQIFNEGWRWGEVAAWQHWLGGGFGRYWNGWQPVAVLCREWDTSFGPGQNVKRTLKVFNNTSRQDPISVSWEVNLAGKRIAGGSKEFSLAPGTDSEWLIHFTLPPATATMQGSLILTAQRNNREIYRDTRTIRLLAPQMVKKPHLKAAELMVYDPHGTVSTFLATRDIPFTTSASLDDIPASAKVLILGTDAIPLDRVADPQWSDRALSGLKVLVLDQRNPLRYRAITADLEPLDDEPSVWARMQAKAAGLAPELRGRYGFMEDLSHPAFAGLVQDDFFTWGNDHVVYRNPYRKGNKGYRSLFQCEEGLVSTALVECQVGDGLMILSQLAIGEKLATNAVAQHVFSQLLNYTATYAPVRRPVQVAAGPAITGLLTTVGVQQSPLRTPLDALLTNGIAVIEASPENLSALVSKAEAVRRWCSTGNWLMLWGVTPEGLADFNTLVRANHVLRPCTAERILLATPADSLTAGITLRDVVMDTGENMYPWMAMKKPDANEFTWIVDHTDIAPFCQFPSPTDVGKSSDTDPGADHWPRNMVNGFTSADNWAFCYTIVMDRGHKLTWTMTLPHEAEITALKIQPSRIYHPITQINLYFDEDPAPVAINLRLDPVAQEIAIAPRKAKRITMEVAKWVERGDANIVVIDNLWLNVKRPDDYMKRVKPLLNIGGLMRYDEGLGGVVLNQLKLVEHEVNPANGAKKCMITKTILANLGAVFAGQTVAIASSQLSYEPLTLPVERCTAYVGHNKQPAWWTGPTDLIALPVGEQRFAGVRFLLPKFTTSPVPTTFMLGGQGSTVAIDRIESLPIARTAQALLFLHTFNASEELERHLGRMKEQRRAGIDPGEFPVVLTYVVHYADGSTAQVPIRYGREVGNWLTRAPAALSAATVGWAGTAVDGQQPVVWVAQWNNPHPQSPIATIDIIAGAPQWGAAAVFAMSAATMRK